MLPSEVSTFFQDWKAKGRDFTMLVIGDCGSGKTTLINNLLGGDIAQEQAPFILTTFHGVFQGVLVTVHETSGLENPSAEGDMEFKEKLSALLRGGKLDVIIYCLKATETRIRNSLVNSLQKYTDMGLDWRKTVIAVTLANSLPISAGEKKATSFTVADLFKRHVNNYTQEIKQALKHVGVASDVVEAIQVAPTEDDGSERLPNGEEWFQAFWSCLLNCLKVPPLPTSTKEAQHLNADFESVQTFPASSTGGEAFQSVPSDTDREPIQTPPTGVGDAQCKCNLCLCLPTSHWCTCCCTCPLSCLGMQCWACKRC